MSNFWFQKLKNVCPNHLVDTSDDVIKSKLQNWSPELMGRSVIVQKAMPLTIECVARGYIMGSLYKEYKKHGRSIHDLDLPDGLKEGDRLQEIIFTPATKATTGHDENISFNESRNRVGGEIAELAKKWTLELYRKAAEHAATAGLILADTKFEFGLTDDGLILIDEALTPDSSRYWQADKWQPGGPQPSFDKQFVRDYLEEIGWNKQPPGPELPEDVISKTRAKYLECYKRITGHDLLS